MELITQNVHQTKETVGVKRQFNDNKHKTERVQKPFTLKEYNVFKDPVNSHMYHCCWGAAARGKFNQKKEHAGVKKHSNDNKHENEKV